jgi:hypothetical protein
MFESSSIQHRARKIGTAGLKGHYAVIKTVAAKCMLALRLLRLVSDSTWALVGVWGQANPWGLVKC